MANYLLPENGTVLKLSLNFYRGLSLRISVKELPIMLLESVNMLGNT